MPGERSRGPLADRTRPRCQLRWIQDGGAVTAVAVPRRRWWVTCLLPVAALAALAGVWYARSPRAPGSAAETAGGLPGESGCSQDFARRTYGGLHVQGQTLHPRLGAVRTGGGGRFRGHSRGLLVAGQQVGGLFRQKRDTKGGLGGRQQPQRLQDADRSPGSGLDHYLGFARGHRICY